MRLQFCGHSCFLIQAQGLRILVDPFIRPNAAAMAIDADSLTPTH
ncbi:MAG: MBL fold metallo-hydrolase, partial [Flavobacteriales bacterium]